jgi:hypothetical protein
MVFLPKAKIKLSIRHQFKTAATKLKWGQDCILRFTEEHFCGLGPAFTTLPLPVAAKPLG